MSHIPSDGVGDRKGALLLEHVGDHRDEEEEVPRLLGDVGRIGLVDGLDELVGLLDDGSPKAGRGLLPVPGAAVAVAEPRHDGVQPLEGPPRGLRPGIDPVGLALRTHELPFLSPRCRSFASRDRGPLPEDSDEADEPDELAARTLGKVLGELAPGILELAEAELHELVLLEELGQARGQLGRGPRAAQADRAVQGLRQAGEEATLPRAQITARHG